jgi:mRNA interferase MazF
MNRIEPLRGEIWTVNLDPTRGREQAGSRPALVFSTNAFNRGPAELIVVIPITSKAKGIPLHVTVQAPEGGIKTVSYIKTEDIRSISKDRLGKRWGSVSQQTLHEVADRVRILLEL